MLPPIVKYNNGNYDVTLCTLDGTKIRETHDEDATCFNAAFPESMDIKICNKCDMGCPMCHEDSTPDGSCGDILNATYIETLHPYTELAIGGGNPLEHPDLIQFLLKLKNLKMIPSMTVNQVHFENRYTYVRSLVDNHLIYGLGISLVDPTEKFINTVRINKNAVIHVIAGVHSVADIMKLENHGLKILILGYKKVRRGATLYIENTVAQRNIEERINELYDYLPTMIDGRFDVVSFDNLAIQQLNPQRLMSKKEWDEMYMGDDGLEGEMTSASMYIDMVENKFAKNSCSMNRFDTAELTVEQMFNKLRLYT